jgi:hypothetical protein
MNDVTTATTAEAVAKTNKPKDPNKPVSFLLRMMPAYKELLETVALRAGGNSVYLDMTDGEERAGNMGEWQIPDSLNQMILHLADLGLGRIWEPLEDALAQDRKARDDYRQAIVWIGEHPDETQVPGDVLPSSSRTWSRSEVLRSVGDLDTSIAGIEASLAAIEAYMAPRTAD